MKNNVSLVVFTLITLSSCERNTTETYILKNGSAAKVKIMPYKSGLIDSLSIINLNTGDENKLEVNTYRGKNNSPQYLVGYFAHVDSVAVIWNDTFKVLHIPDSNNYQGVTKTIDTTSDRNIGSVTKYILQKKEKKHSNSFTLTYTFTDDDYEYAKD